MAGLLTRPGHRAFPVLHQWQKFDVRFCVMVDIWSIGKGDVSKMRFLFYSILKKLQWYI